MLDWRTLSQRYWGNFIIKIYSKNNVYSVPLEGDSEFHLFENNMKLFHPYLEPKWSIYFHNTFHLKLHIAYVNYYITSLACNPVIEEFLLKTTILWIKDHQKYFFEPAVDVNIDVVVYSSIIPYNFIFHMIFDSLQTLILFFKMHIKIWGTTMQK